MKRAAPGMAPWTIGLVLLPILGTLILPATGAASGLGAEVDQGRSLAQALHAGERGCGELSSAQLELIGEYAMDRFLGNRSAHEAMNAHMVAMMGGAGERRMHIALGRRYGGCGPVSSYGWMGPMLGMMGGTGGGYASGSGQGMMGGGYGSMMGRHGPGGHHDRDGIDAFAVAAIAIGAALLAGLLVALVIGGRQRRSQMPPAA
ncbi:MAG TPA: hypothetical protein VF030_01755 [Solirubrobacterales bacterium]